MYKLITLFLTLSLLAPASPEGGTANRQFLVKSNRILFLGDSITYKGQFVSNFEVWLKALYQKRNFDTINLGLPSETLSGLSEEGHADNKFPRPELFTRLDSALEKIKPDLIFACYGMNCGIYQPFDKNRFQKYQEGILKLKTKAEAAGAQIIFITPPIFDEHQQPQLKHYRTVLEQYSQWLITKRQDGWHVIDLQSHMRKALDEQRKTNPAFTYQQDAVHPDTQGHWIMTQPLIAWFGDIPSAQSNSNKELLAMHKLSPSLIPLIQKRMQIKRDAWLTYTGHTRPGIAKGLSIDQAHTQIKSTNKEIKRLILLSE